MNKQANETFVEVPIFQLMQWKYGLKLEIQGLKHSRGSVYAHVKKTLGWRGNRQSILNQLEELIEEIKYAR